MHACTCSSKADAPEHLRKRLEEAVKALEEKAKIGEKIEKIEEGFRQQFRQDFKSFYRQALARKAALDKIGADDELDEVYKFLNQLSKLSH